MLNINTAITIKAYNRYDYLNETLEGLSKCIGIENYQIIISLDYSNIQAKIEQLINSYENRLNILLYKADKKLGCAGNMKRCFELCFDTHKYKYMFHIEDDMVPAIDYIEFMESISNKYNNNDIFAICPYRRKTGLLINKNQAKEYIDGIVFDGWFECAGGFGMSKEIYEYIKTQGGIVGKGNDFNRAWAFAFASKYSKGRKCVHPIVNRIKNIGEVGIHLPIGNQIFKNSIYVDWDSNIAYERKILEYKLYDIKNITKC